MAYTKILDIPKEVLEDISFAIVNRNKNGKISKFFQTKRFDTHASTKTKEWLTEHELSPTLVAWFIKRGEETIHPIFCKECGKELTIEQYLGGHEYCSNACGVNSKERKEKTKETCLKKYGVENPMQSSEVKENLRKAVNEKYGVDYVTQLDSQKEKSKKTCLEKYGVERYAQSSQFLTEVKQQWIEKYGVENPMFDPSIKEKQKESVKLSNDSRIRKVRETCLQKYGSPSSLGGKEVREKIKKTCLLRYGVDNAAKSKDVMQPSLRIVRKKQYAWFVEYLKSRNLTLLESEEAFLNDNIHKFKCNTCGTEFEHKAKKFITCPNCKHGVSSQEKALFSYLEQIIETHKNVRGLCGGNKEIDLLIPSLNLGIEFNGTYWHSTRFRNKTYHQEKSIEALKHGIVLFHVFEFENFESIKTLIEGVLLNESLPSDIKISKLSQNIDTVNKNTFGIFHDDKLFATFDLNQNKLENFVTTNHRLNPYDINALKEFFNMKNLCISYDFTKPLIVDEDIVLSSSISQPRKLIVDTHGIICNDVEKRCHVLYDCGTREIVV